MLLLSKLKDKQQTGRKYWKDYYPGSKSDSGHTACRATICTTMKRKVTQGYIKGKHFGKGSKGVNTVP